MPPALKCESPGLFMRERRSKKNTKKGSFFCWRKLQCVSRILREEEVYERGAAPTKIKISQRVAQFLAPQNGQNPLSPFFAHCNTHISPKNLNQIRSPKSYLFFPPGRSYEKFILLLASPSRSYMDTGQVVYHFCFKHTSPTKHNLITFAPSA